MSISIDDLVREYKELVQGMADENARLRRELNELKQAGKVENASDIQKQPGLADEQSGLIDEQRDAAFIEAFKGDPYGR